MQENLNAKLDQYIKDCVLYYDLPGVALGAGIIGENFICEGAAGYKNIEKKELLKKDDIFHMASITKLFTSTAILMLVEQGKLKLDDKMIDILPKPSIDDKRYKEVTIKHILTHTSGIFESKFLHDPSDKKFVYADLEYDTLGTVIEVVSGLYYDEFVNEKILKPLNMNDSEISITLRPGLVPGYEKDEDKRMMLAEPFGYCRERAPSSTLTSNVSDMRKWGEEVLVNKTLLCPETYKFAMEAYAPIPEMQQEMCMSWFKNEMAEHTWFGHIGSDPGYRIGFWCCPELNAHFTVMSNITKTPILRMCREIADILKKGA